MNHGETWFGGGDNAATGFVILLLFTLSAAVVSSLVFGLSVYLFLDNKKNESVTAAIYSVGWLAVITMLGLLSLAILR